MVREYRREGDLWRVVASEAGEVNTVFAADLDNDHDVDVVSASFASRQGGSIAWYENTDGKGTFGPQQIISTRVQGAWSIYGADADGDGDVDVFSASYGDNLIAWYENTDGSGNFGDQRIISFDARFAAAVFVIDLDADGDVDVLSASINDDKIAWYENTDGRGTFSRQKIITTEALAANSVFAIDADGDGDVDVFSASSVDNTIAWYENLDGKGMFGEKQVITESADGATDVVVIDVDGDGDVDVFSASSRDDIITWYESRQIGDSNDDGIFDSSDLVTIFTAGKFETGSDATFNEGDWNLDGVFDSADMVLAIQVGHYVTASTPRTDRLAAALDQLFTEDDRS